ncbi:MAG: hypothetical protein E3J25_08085, partial [Anaerolineales bacterium]
DTTWARDSLYMGLVLSDWSPDGTRLAFIVSVALVTINADGTGAEEIGDSLACKWAPDGKRIAIADFLTQGLWTADPDGSYPYLLAQTVDWDNRDKPINQIAYNSLGYDVPGPAWSPDGKKIVFTSLWDGNPEIYVVDRDGKNLTRLTRNLAYDLNPVWSPDGTMIAFSSNRDGNFDIFVMRADGSQQVKVAHSAVSPAWASGAK